MQIIMTLLIIAYVRLEIIEKVPAIEVEGILNVEEEVGREQQVEYINYTNAENLSILNGGKI